MSKILYVLRYYPTLTETFIYREIKELQRRGVEITIAAIGARSDGVLADGLPQVEVIRPPRWITGPRKRQRRWRWIARRAAGVTQVHAHFEGEPAIWAEQIAAHLGVPWSVTVHATGLFTPRPGIGGRLRRASQVITVCTHHQRWISDRYGVSAKLVRCGVTVPSIQARPGASVKVITVARDVPKKDLHRLRRACAELRLPLQQVHRLPPSQVSKALAKATLFALPCRVAPGGGADGIPVAMMEAMAVGLPVVTRPISGIPDLVDDTVGWIGLDFEAQLRAAIECPEERIERGSRARRRVQSEWTIQRSVDALWSAWDTLRP